MGVTSTFAVLLSFNTSFSFSFLTRIQQLDLISTSFLCTIEMSVDRNTITVFLRAGYPESSVSSDQFMQKTTACFVPRVLRLC